MTNYHQLHGKQKTYMSTKIRFCVIILPNFDILLYNIVSWKFEFCDDILCFKSSSPKLFRIYSSFACQVAHSVFPCNCLNKLHKENANFEIAILKIFSTGFFWKYRYRPNFWRRFNIYLRLILNQIRFPKRWSFVCIKNYNCLPPL